MADSWVGAGHGRAAGGLGRHRHFLSRPHRRRFRMVQHHLIYGQPGQELPVAVSLSRYYRGVRGCPGRVRPLFRRQHPLLKSLRYSDILILND